MRKLVLLSGLFILASKGFAVGFERIPAEEWPPLFGIITKDFANSLIEEKNLDAEEAERQAAKTWNPIKEPASISDKHVYSITANNISVGFIVFRIDDSSGRTRGKISYIHVFKAHRRNGYAKQALEQAATVLSTEGAEDIFLHVFKSNKVAKSLYKKCGFELEEELDDRFRMRLRHSV